MTSAAQALLLAGSAGFLAAGIWDIVRRRIPNLLVVALLGSFAVYAFVAEPPTTWTLLTCVIYFVVGAGLFYAGVWGGGDAKLIAVASLWVGSGSAGELALLTSVLGGILALFVLAYDGILRNILRVGSPTNGQRKRSVPYGVAIAAATLWLIWHPVLG